MGGLNGRGSRLENGRQDGWAFDRVTQRGSMGRLDVNWLLNAWTVKVGLK